jgi:hypothetical protein
MSKRTKTKPRSKRAARAAARAPYEGGLLAAVRKGHSAQADEANPYRPGRYQRNPIWQAWQYGHDHANEALEQVEQQWRQRRKGQLEGDKRGERAAARRRYDKRRKQADAGSNALTIPRLSTMGSLSATGFVPSRELTFEEIGAALEALSKVERCVQFAAGDLWVALEDAGYGKRTELAADGEFGGYASRP